MSGFNPFDFIAPYDFNLSENTTEAGSKLVKDELNLWSTAQFTYDSQAAPENQMISSSFDPFILNMHTPPVNTPGISPELNFFTENTQFPGLISPHPAFPVNATSPPTQANSQYSFQNSTSPIEPETKPASNKRKQSDAKKPADISAEEDKRRRNTAASARFRIKKKLREQVLESTAQEMTAKAESLENKVKELEKEVEWLRSLLLEKNPSLLKSSDVSNVTE
ncbi:hypothetical protein K493DRAFT_22390 [Basidiobolus meristosporus CBS 931.73]|uniref:BZIP domain-containing protein n=1 Tax=Basidiobolus meristosporus CBS 931.73 TaxID=1314790 RepID=A0A1Y1YCT1_9FUNG|nr:hypothetical protein K493DRAFT_22390 [Basidiobolus meristosporus CBS 931.73]|eukprot:ORX95841.1 hypothetical protein K493DRAFT_22390 [Basidiobolus meristosporus CBS 931.73]